MASFGDLLAKAFPNNQVQAATQKQVPALNTTVTKPTTSFGQLMNPSGASKTTVAKSSGGSPILASVTGAKPSQIQAAVQAGTAGGNTTRAVGGSSGVTIPAFSFDWSAADKEALEKLTPYYEGLLAQAQGDIDLAKQRLEQDYQTGIRQRAEDQTSQTAEDKRAALEETRNALTNLNTRGVLIGEKTPGDQSTSAAPTSDYANSYYLNPMKERQSARALAIQRAFSRQQEQSDLTKGRQMEDMATQFSRYKGNLEEEKKNKAINQMAPLQYQQELAKYNAALSGVLNA